jgi:membrane associated rhomboid family serine protease
MCEATVRSIKQYIISKLCYFYTMYNNNNGLQINTSSAVFNLIAINVFFFAVSSLLPGLFPSTALDAAISPADMFLGLHYPSSEYFRPFQIITHMFMHGGISHIFFNMFNLYIFGNILERVWGPKRFLEFYFLTGFGAMLLYTAVQALEVYNMTGSLAPPLHIVNSSQSLFGVVNFPVIGASGAVFGIQIGFAMLFPNTELMLMFIPVPIKAKYLIGGLVAYELYNGFANSPNDHVAHFAHIGGALIGFIIIKIWNRNSNSLY